MAVHVSMILERKGRDVITIKRAYQELEMEGVIVTRQGKGSFVAERPALANDLRAAELDEHLERARRVGTAMGLSIEEIAERLHELGRAPAAREDA